MTFVSLQQQLTLQEALLQKECDSISRMKHDIKRLRNKVDAVDIDDFVSPRIDQMEMEIDISKKSRFFKVEAARRAT